MMDVAAPPIATILDLALLSSPSTAPRIVSPTPLRPLSVEWPMTEACPRAWATVPHGVIFLTLLEKTFFTNRLMRKHILYLDPTIGRQCTWRLWCIRGRHYRWRPGL
jgi:hypothetical protein